ncbi:MAG TPA: hypothetical protein GXX53_06905 [Tissierellia bacterium]|nr:hypothetical protein [Tissierellia bacterium]
MWRRFTALLFVLIIITSISSFAFADDVDSSKYQVILPKEEASAYKNKVLLISGQAPIGTKVSIELYGVVDLTGSKYSLVNLPKKEDYTLISTIDVESGPLGFAKEIELIRGINKIIVNFNVEGIAPIERIVYYYEAQQIFETLKNSSVIPTAN